MCNTDKTNLPLFAQRKYTRFWLKRWLRRHDNAWFLFVVLYFLGFVAFQLTRSF